MAVKTRITEKRPRTGALPSEQDAASFKELHPDNGGKQWVWQQDKLIWQLVQNCVDYASDQFSENLQFNSETLTNVLYDNLYDLLGEKFEEDEFVEWVAEELVKNGAVTKTTAPEAKTQEKAEPKEEVVYELDDSAYKDLVSKVDASVKLLKANKLNIFKLFAEAQEKIKDFSDEKNGVEKDEKNLMRLRDEQITALVNKIQGNQKTLEDYIQTQEDNREELQEQIDGIQEKFDEYVSEREKSTSENRKLLDSIKKTLGKLVKTSSELEKKSAQASKQKPVEPPKPVQVPEKEEQAKKEPPKKPEKKEPPKKETPKPPVKEKPDTGKQQKKQTVPANKPVTSPPKPQKQSVKKPAPPKKQAPSKLSPKVQKKQIAVLKKETRPEGKKEKPPLSLKQIHGILKKLVEEHFKKTTKGENPARKMSISPGKVKPNVMGTPKATKPVRKVISPLKPSKPVESAKSIVKTPNAAPQLKTITEKLGKTKLPAKLSKGLGKELGGKIPLNAFDKKDSKAALGVVRKSPQEQEDFVRKMVMKKVMDGKIKTPIPAPLIKPMMKVEETFNNLADKGEKIAGKFLPKGKSSPMVSKMEGHLGKFAEKQPRKFSLKEIENFGRGKLPPRKTTKPMTQMKGNVGKPPPMNGPRTLPKKPSFSKAAPVKARGVKQVSSAKVSAPKVSRATSKVSIARSKVSTASSKVSSKALSQMGTKLGRSLSTKATKAVGKKGGLKLALAIRSKPILENMGFTPTPKNILKSMGGVKHAKPGFSGFMGGSVLSGKPKGELDLVGAVKKNAKYNLEQLPSDVEMLTGGSSKGKAISANIGQFTQGLSKSSIFKSGGSKAGFAKSAGGVLSKAGFGGGGGAGVPPKPPGGGGGIFGRKLPMGGSPLSGAAPSSSKANEKKKPQKPTLGQKVKGMAKRAATKVVVKVIRVKDRVKNALAKSPLGSIARAAGKVFKTIGTVVKVMAKVVKTVVKVVVKTVKVMWKTAKFAAKAFIGASKVVGGALRAVVKGTVKGVRSFMQKVKKKGFFGAIRDINGARFVTKLGWRAIKWAARKLWGWIKKVAFNLTGVFRRFFKFGGKFANKTSYYLGRILKGVKDKAYRFIAKPIAGILVAVVGSMTSLVMAPVKFLQWVVPSILERFRSVVRDFKEASIDLYKSTWSLFKRILFNPITIALLIGALVYFFWPTLVEWIQGGIANLGKNLWGTVSSWVSNIWEFGKTVWSCIVPVATAIFKFVAWVTDPDNWVMQIVFKVLGLIRDIKKVVVDVMKIAGYDSLDFTCMWMAGDTIGLALAALEALCISAWRWFSNQPFIRKVIAMIKALCKAKKLVADLPGVMWDSFSSVVKNVFTGKWGRIIDDAVAPWKKWWGDLKNAMDNNYDYDETYETHRVKLYESASVQSRKTKQDIIIATRSLKMKGMYSERNIKFMDSISRVTNSIANKNVLGRIEQMSRLYMNNVENVENYQKFIQSVWEEGNMGDEQAALMIKSLLESPVLSQRLMSPFFYYNPQTAEVMMMRPAAYIGQFIQNIRNLVGTNENRDNIGVLKKIVMAFDQMNEEKWYIVNEQGKVINRFINQVYSIDINDKRNGYRNEIILRNMTRRFNRGNLFTNIRTQQSFEQFQKKDSTTEKLKSKATGEEFGNNELLQVKPLTSSTNNGRRGIPVNTTVADYKVKMPEKQATPSNQGQSQFGNISIGPDISPFDSDDALKRQKLSREQMYQKFEKYQQTRLKKVAELDSVDKAAQAGYENISFQEFVRRYEKATQTAEEQEKKAAMGESERAKKMAGLRIVKGIQDWQKQGKDFDGDLNFVSIGGKDANTIWNVHTDDIEQDLYMFSPPWNQMVLKQRMKDDELLTALEEGGANLKKLLDADTGSGRSSDEEWGEPANEEETEDERIAREEREMQEREKEALDFSAKIKDGYIEVKVDEDDEQIEREWYQNQGLFAKLSQKMTPEEIEKEYHIKSYPRYDDWVRYWRKKNGHPLDGIRRYKFEGKPVEHKVEFSVRKALTAEELASHGIQVSENGPVMIPADKAFEIAKSFFASAKSVYTIRDGLEVMKMGVDHECEEVRKRNARGPVVAAMGIPNPVGQNGTAIQDPPVAPSQAS